eukprot:TRINITY_DN9842_c0_g2_i5.p3 TRINITY_DN9842_c0_g2~~TRINITY_DN9842_c0_g2_i5.p3  ORF type:complete len:106 (-),score=5.94 TRINITY_DN9842_c0_g2_i5:21-338(-)
MRCASPGMDSNDGRPYSVPFSFASSSPQDQVYKIYPNLDTEAIKNRQVDKKRRGSVGVQVCQNQQEGLGLDDSRFTKETVAYQKLEIPAMDCQLVVPQQDSIRNR